MIDDLTGTSSVVTVNFVTIGITGWKIDLEFAVYERFVVKV